MKRTILISTILFLFFLSAIGQDIKSYRIDAYFAKQKNDFNTAIDLYSKVIAIEPTGSDLCNRGNCYSEINEEKKAIDDYLSAIKFYQTDKASLAILYENIGSSYSSLEEYTISLKYYNLALETDPSNNSIYFKKADILKIIGEYPKAVAEYSKAINLDNTDYASYYWRGYLYGFYLKEPALANADLKKVIELDTDSSIYTPYAKVLTGSVEQGIALMKARIAKTTDKKEEYYNMAGIQALIGNENEAIRYLDLAFKNGYNDYKFLKEDPDINNIRYKSAFKSLIVKYKIPYNFITNNISELIKGEVKGALALWQEKGEFETNQQYIDRMKQRDAMVSSLTEKSLEKFKKKHIEEAKLNYFTLEKYDSESQTFKINYSATGDVAIVKVPLSEAPAFKENQSKLKLSKANFIIQNDAWVLSYVEIANPVTSKTYRYDITKQENYDPTTKFVLNYDDVKIDLPNQNVAVNQNTSNNSNTKIVLGKPEVDTNIPTASTQKTNTYCLIIGNEDYSSYQTGLSTEVNVDFAANDAKIFKEYCNKTLGIPEKQIKLLVNATAGQMNQGMAWLTNLAKIDNGEAELIFYYSGHGLPDEATKEAYLIPVDISGSNVTSGIKVNDVYAELNEFPSKKITVFLDACFSGGARSQGLVAMKGVKFRPKDNIVTGNMVVFSSSTGEESSGVYREKQHGYMTYFLLKKLQETKGEVCYKDFAEFIINNVKKETALSGKIQTPQLNYSPAVEELWTNWKLK